MGKYGTLLISSNEIDETGALRREERRGSEKSVPLVNGVDGGAGKMLFKPQNRKLYLCIIP